MEENNETVWQHLDALDPSERAKIIIGKLFELQCKYVVTEMDAIDQSEAIEDDLTEWLQSTWYACYCTDKVPVTDCEGCNFVMTCTNNYGISEKDTLACINCCKEKQPK